MTNPYTTFDPPGDTTNRTPKMLAGYKSAPVVNGDPPPAPAPKAAVCVDLCIADGSSALTLTNQPAGETDYWQRSPWFDPNWFTKIRVIVDDVEAAGAATSKIIVKFKAGGIGSWTDAGIGATQVSVPIATTGPQKTTSWVNINSDALVDSLWHVFAIGGDGSVSPIVAGVHIQFLAGDPVMIPLSDCLVDDGGCPMPAEIYNGEDFSTYADEAAFLTVAEGNEKNFYNVWYGADGSVEGCSYATGITFCGNPVVRGRWKAVSSGSNIWDIVGYGNYTRFANPLLDNGGSSGGQLVRFRSVWTTIRFRIESGWSSDGGVGFLISELFDAGNGINGSCRVYLKAGRVVVLAQADSSVSLETTDIGPASMLVGTSDFVEVTTHGTATDQGGGIWRIMFEVFVNPACSGGPAGAINTATPQATYTADVVPIPIGGVVNNLGFYTWDKFNYTSTPAQWPEKYIDVAQAFYSGSLT